MKRIIAALAAVTAVVVLASPAGAHVPVIEASCADGLSVSLTSYNPSGVNTVEVEFNDDVVADTTFATSYSLVVPNPDKTEDHTYRVRVDAHDGTTWDRDVSGTIEACEDKPEPPEEPEPPVEEEPEPPVITLPPDAPVVVREPVVPAPPVAVVAAPTFTG